MSRCSGTLPIPGAPDLQEQRRFIRAEARAILRHRGLPDRDFLEDAEQDGFEGLAHAAKRFEEHRGTAFLAYARPFIRGAILDALDRARRSKVLASLLQGADASAADFVATQDIGDEAYDGPGPAEAAMRRSLEDYLTAMELGYLGAIRRLDPEAQLAARREYATALQILGEELASLPERDQQVLALREVEELRWQEVAARMSSSKATVERWYGQAIGRLGRALRSRGLAGVPEPPDAG